MKTPSFEFLGQSGILLVAHDFRIAIDLYLSNSVADKVGSDLARRVPIPTTPQQLSDVSCVCLTHVHLDHTDPSTLVPLAAAASEARFYGPHEVTTVLRSSGITGNRIALAAERWIQIGPRVQMRAVPAAHVRLERDRRARLRYCGYLFRIDKTLVYHAGDTMPHPDVVAAVNSEGYPDVAFLPCNERNIYRERAGIVGNMSVREMLAFAAELRAKRIVALHWDMFRPNSVLPEEINLVARFEAPNLPLLIPRCGMCYDMNLREIAQDRADRF